MQRQASLLTLPIGPVPLRENLGNARAYPRMRWECWGGSTSAWLGNVPGWCKAGSGDWKSSWIPALLGASCMNMPWCWELFQLLELLLSLHGTCGMGSWSCRVPVELQLGKAGKNQGSPIGEELGSALRELSSSCLKSRSMMSCVHMHPIASPFPLSALVVRGKKGFNLFMARTAGYFPSPPRRDCARHSAALFPAGSSG